MGKERFVFLPQTKTNCFFKGQLKKTNIVFWLPHIEEILVRLKKKSCEGLVNVYLEMFWPKYNTNE